MGQWASVGQAIFAKPAGGAWVGGASYRQGRLEALELVSECEKVWGGLPPTLPPSTCAPHLLIHRSLGVDEVVRAGSPGWDQCPHK